MHLSGISFISNNINKNNLYNKKNINFSSSLLNSMPVNNNKANDKEEKSTKSKWFKLAGLGALLAAAMAKIASIFKRKANPADAMNNIKKLIKLLKPEDIETAKEFYPVLLKNKEALNLKQELINPIMNAISKENMPFMISEGVNLISSKMSAIKECIASEAEDVPRLFKSLTEKNKNMFDFVTNNVKELHIDAIEDIEMFLKLPHNKQKYILNNVLIKLIKNAKELNLRTAERYATISNTMTPECEHLIQQIADFSIPEGKTINKYSVLKMVNKNNKDCVMPLLNNLENSNHNTSQIQKILAVATKENMPSIMAISKHSDILAKLKINTESVRELITNEGEAKVFDFLMEKQEFFNIQELADIKYCLKYIKTDKLQYFSDELIEFLKKNNDLLNFKVPDMIADGLKNADSSILDIVKSVTKYANELKNKKDMCIDYTALVGALNKDNVHKLPKLINLVKQNEDLQFSLITIDDITALLNKIE